MFEPGAPTLDQIRVFLAVVDAGSFAGAARRLRRATSVISYAIGNLEAQLGVDVFDRDTTKRPQLTEAGRALLAEARSIQLGVDRLRARAKGLRQGLESEVSLALDVMLPEARVVDALSAFREAFPTVALRLRVEALGTVTDLVRDGTCAIGVRGPPDVDIDGLERIGAGSVELQPVAAPHHPLARPGRKALGAAREHVQVVLTDRTARMEGLDLGVVGTHTWRVADLCSKHMLLRAGLGWGNMPLPLVAEDLERGRLVRLDLPDFTGGEYDLYLIHRTDTPPGPAGRFLMERLVDQARPGALAPDRFEELGGDAA